MAGDNRCVSFADAVQHERRDNTNTLSSPASAAQTRQRSGSKASSAKQHRDRKIKRCAARDSATAENQSLEPTDPAIQDWSSQGLFVIPEEVFRGRHISVPGAKQMLRRLIVSNNNLSGLPPAICSLTNLEYLDISGNTLIMEDEFTGDPCFPEKFHLLPNLRTLIVSECGLIEIPAAIWNTTSLQTLDLSRNKVGFIPSDIGSLTNIRQLRLCWMDLVTLPPEIGVCDQLESIHLIGNPLDSLPDTLVECRRLHELRLSYRVFRSSLDEYIEQLIDDGKVTSQHIPTVIFELEGLRTLDLSHAKINCIPSGQTLVNLTELYLTHNSFAEIPEVVCRLTQLKTLDMSFNHVSDVPQCLAHLKQLEQLDLSENELTSLSVVIGWLPRLRTLTADHNQICAIDKGFSASLSLLALDVSYNCLTHLPYEFCELRQLETLDLRYNRLAYLPWSMRQMTSLTSMHCFTADSRRTGLHLLGNPFVDPPKHVWNCTEIQTLFNYMEVQERSRLNAFYHLKLILIGSKNSGKTTLACALLRRPKLVKQIRKILDTQICLAQDGQSHSSLSRMNQSAEILLQLYKKLTFVTENDLYCTMLDVTSQPSYEILQPLIYDANALHLLPIDLTNLLQRVRPDSETMDLKTVLTDDWFDQHIFRYLKSISDYCQRVCVAIVGLQHASPIVTTVTGHEQALLDEIRSRVTAFLLAVHDQLESFTDYSHWFPTPIDLGDEAAVTSLIEQLEVIARSCNRRHHKFKANLVKRRLGFDRSNALVVNYEACLTRFHERSQQPACATDDDEDEQTESHRVVMEEEVNQMTFDECLDYLQLIGDIQCVGRQPQAIILCRPHFLLNRILASTLFRPDLDQWLDYRSNVMLRYSGYYPSEALFQADRQRLLSHGQFTWRMLKSLFFERTAHDIDVNEWGLLEYCRLMQRLDLGYLTETSCSGEGDLTPLPSHASSTYCFECPRLIGRVSDRNTVVGCSSFCLLSCAKP